jgi:predicted transcriptional regulator
MNTELMLKERHAVSEDTFVELVVWRLPSPVTGSRHGFKYRLIFTLVLSSREGTNRRFLRAFEGESQGTFISFESPALLFKVLTGKRWDLLNMMTGAGPMTIRQAARRLGRDVKAVHGDVHALMNTGMLQKTDNGRIEFPFDAVHVDFTLKAA